MNAVRKLPAVGTDAKMSRRMSTNRNQIGIDLHLIHNNTDGKRGSKTWIWQGGHLHRLGPTELRASAPKVSQSPFWTPITPKAGSLLHADPHEMRKVELRAPGGTRVHRPN